MIRSGRWEPNSRFEIGGLQFRVVLGKKTPRAAGEQDYRLDICLRGSWEPVPMRLAAFLIDFFYENEDVLYPRHLGYKGGEKFMQYLRRSARDGYMAADSALQSERIAQQSFFEEAS